MSVIKCWLLPWLFIGVMTGSFQFLVQGTAWAEAIAKWHAILCLRGTVDTLTSEQRSERMARIKGKNTRPEMTVRRLVWSLGYRYRLHQRDLPGCPDLVFIARRKAIFVHGCFWHRHEGCKLAPSGQIHRKDIIT
jgi:DNA mismatch endonuclease Vsr